VLLPSISALRFNFVGRTISSVPGVLAAARVHGQRFRPRDTAEFDVGPVGEHSVPFQASVRLRFPRTSPNERRRVDRNRTRVYAPADR